MPKYLQFSPSQQIKEACSRQDTPSPPDNEQRNCPLRGLDFLLSPFPQSRQEKEKETEEKYLQFSSSQQIKEAYPCQDHPSPPTNEQRKRPLRGLDFFLSPFLVSRQEKEREGQEKRSQLSSSQHIREAHPYQDYHSPCLIAGHSYQIFQPPTVRDTRFRSVFQSQRLRVDHTRQDFQSPSPTKVKTRRKSQSPTMKDHNPRCRSISPDRKESHPHCKCNLLDPIETYLRCKIYTHGSKEDLMRCI